MSSTAKRMSAGTLVFNCVCTTIFFPVLILLLAGNWSWAEGWIFGLWLAAMILSDLVYLYLKDPALLAERTTAPGADNQKRWDKYLLVGILLTVVLWLVIMPLDAQRFKWSPAFPGWLKLLGGVLLLPALYLIFRATAENAFLSTKVRIQGERKQQVISTGVYGFVRHPLYLGCVLMMFGAPLLLGSIAGLLISLLAAAILAGRIIGEERMLTEELQGYPEYKKKVNYRLIPFVW